MGNNMTMQGFINTINKSELRRCSIPMELSSGWPFVSIKKNTICVTIPYFATQRTKEKDYLLFPLSYLMTVTWSNGKIVELLSLKYNKEYKAIDFSKPVGVFKHEAVKDMNAEEYNAKKVDLYACYDKLIECITEKKSFDDEEKMRTLFKVLMEPGLYPMYKFISPKFYETYCGLDNGKNG
jgi:hypothetical protein